MTGANTHTSTYQSGSRSRRLQAGPLGANCVGGRNELRTVPPANSRISSIRGNDTASPEEILHDRRTGGNRPADTSSHRICRSRTRDRFPVVGMGNRHAAAMTAYGERGGERLV